MDRIDRLVIDNCDYRALGDVKDDVLLLEWDIAVTKEELVAFTQQANEDRGRVLVAPYRIYYEHMLVEPVWAHRHWDGLPAAQAHPGGAKPVIEGDPTCNLFGLGMVYLPRDLVVGFMESGFANHFGDVEFSMWHYRFVRPEVPIAWDVRPVHLNYTLEGAI